MLLPHLAGRPVTFTRWPHGVEGASFFEKNNARNAPSWVQHVVVPAPGSTKDRETLDMVLLTDVPDLAWSANLAALELHVPHGGSTTTACRSCPTCWSSTWTPAPAPGWPSAPRSPSGCGNG